MANVPTGGVRKKLTLQTKKRYQIYSPAARKDLNNVSGKSELFTKCDSTPRKELLSLCIPKSSTTPPLPTSKLQVISDIKREEARFSSLPAPNFELLTRSFAPLSLKRCPPHSIVVLDEQNRSMSVATTTAHRTVLTTSMHQVGWAISCDAQRESRLELANQHTALNLSPVVQKNEGVAAAMCSSHVIQRQSKMNSPTVHSSHQQKQVQNSHKNAWNEINDDDEFDKLCEMVDLSFDADVDTEQKTTKVMTPDNEYNDGNVNHIVTGALMTQSWTCPMCNELFEGRTAEDYECEQHLIQCLAMDVV